MRAASLHGSSTAWDSLTQDASSLRRRRALSIIHIALVLHNMETSIERLPQVVSYRNSPKSLNDP